jgi:hypothetical protein
MLLVLEATEEKLQLPVVLAIVIPSPPNDVILKLEAVNGVFEYICEFVFITIPLLSP